MKYPGVNLVLVAGCVLAGAVLIVGAQSPSQPAISGSANPPQSAAAPTAPKLAEDQFKNIQVLKGVPADQVIPAMQFIANSLHVECEYCHVERAFEKDDKEEKKTARKMMQMVQGINKNYFDGHREVTCATCHNGKPNPMSVPPIADERTPPPLQAAEHGPAAGAQGPTPESIIDKYVQALGGPSAIQKVNSMVEKGTINVGEETSAFEVFSQAPDKRISVVHRKDGDSVTAFNGKEGWMALGTRPPREMHGPELDAARLDADLHLATNLKTLFSRFRLGRPEKIADREMNVVIAAREGQPPLRLYFDKESGLLTRMVRYADSPLGRNPTQIDYADYRDLGGWKTPYRWTLARPNGRFTIQITEAQANVPIDPSRFTNPAPHPPTPVQGH
jgi:photosynthetic reaction center cytochrome c subunit